MEAQETKVMTLVVERLTKSPGDLPQQINRINP